MIQATELRIGNIVFDDNKNMAIINGFAPFGYSTRCDEAEGCNVLFDIVFQDKTKSKNWTCQINDLSPIPLTEEILLKCGFQKLGDTLNTFRLYSKEFSDYLFEIELNEPYYFKVCDLLVNNFYRVQYLHTLQNLTFALTNTELNITL